MGPELEPNVPSGKYAARGWWVCHLGMGGASTATEPRAWHDRRPPRAAWVRAVLVAGCALAVAVAARATGASVLASTGACAAVIAIAIAWSAPPSPRSLASRSLAGRLGTTPTKRRADKHRPGAPGVPVARPVHTTTAGADRQRPRPGDHDLYLDVDAVEVDAVYALGLDLFTHLRGGVGQRTDPSTGQLRPVETTDISLTWHCKSRRSARQAARSLNEWQATRTPLRLLAAQGRCALLMEDDDNWVVLPELKLAS